uniref:Uncharacterized protein n=2 Tax=Zea mays TaxID=4577 RepID=A0A804N4Z6_MAIZE
MPTRTLGPSYAPPPKPSPLNPRRCGFAVVTPSQSLAAADAPSCLMLLPGGDPSRAHAALPSSAAPRGLRARFAAALEAARGAPPATRPEKLIVVFSHGVSVDIARGLAEGFEAVEDDLLEKFISDSDEENEHGWVVVSLGSSEELRNFRAFERLMSWRMWKESRELVNQDTTTLVAIVSGINNGGVGKLMAAPEAETRARFKCNYYKFAMDQVA